MATRLRHRLLSRVSSRLSVDAYRAGGAAAACSAAALSALYVTSSIDEDEGYVELFREAADVVYDGAAAINGEREVRVRLYCTWTEQPAGSSALAYSTHSMLELVRSAERHLSADVPEEVFTGSVYGSEVSRMGEAPALAKALRSADSIVVDSAGSREVRVRLRGDVSGDALGEDGQLLCSRPPTESEARADLLGNCLACAAASIGLGHVVGRVSAATWAAGGEPHTWAHAYPSWARFPVRYSALAGGGAAACAAVIGAVLVPAAWGWRYWTGYLSARERSYGDGSPRLALHELPALAAIGALTCGFFIGVPVALCAAPVGVACGAVFGLVRARPALSEVARRAGT